MALARHFGTFTITSGDDFEAFPDSIDVKVLSIQHRQYEGAFDVLISWYEDYAPTAARNPVTVERSR